MKKIGLTGTIGSGKSIVAQIFTTLGVPVYNADLHAKQIMSTPIVVRQVSDIFGKSVLAANGTINRSALAEIVFHNADKLEILNALIHPLVKADFNKWCHQFESKAYVIQEAAILFESGFNTLFDSVVLVVAPESLCIERVMKRDSITAEMVLARMKNQWPKEKKIELANFIVTNDEVSMLVPQILNVHKQIRDI